MSGAIRDADANHLRDSDAELRQYLAMKSERLRFRARTVEDIGDNFAKLNFRLLLLA